MAIFTDDGQTWSFVEVEVSQRPLDVWSMYL